jgi:hypothetical protein
MAKAGTTTTLPINVQPHSRHAATRSRIWHRLGVLSEEAEECVKSHPLQSFQKLFVEMPSALALGASLEDEQVPCS